MKASGNWICLIRFSYTCNWLLQYMNNICRSHEDMSLKMIDYVVDEHNIDIESDAVKKVKVWLLKCLLLTMFTRCMHDRFILKILIYLGSLFFIARTLNGIDLLQNGHFSVPKDRSLHTRKAYFQTFQFMILCFEL